MWLVAKSRTLRRIVEELANDYTTREKIDPLVIGDSTQRNTLIGIVRKLHPVYLLVIYRRVTLEELALHKWLQLRAEKHGRMAINPPAADNIFYIMGTYVSLQDPGGRKEK